jgi:glycosyltransferase involved in cell wall biosynthesis
MTATLPDYSVLMSVYHGDKAAWLAEALDSMLAQTCQPKEFILMEDGPLPMEIERTLYAYEKKMGETLRRVPLPENVGLGAALNRGVLECRCEYIARMDSDDIAAPTRCEKILRGMMANPQLSLLGCGVDEFVGSKEKIVAHVRLPHTPEEAKRFAKTRIPIRHSSVMFKKTDVIRAGNYSSLRRAQDYDLIVRMLMMDFQISNIPDVLLYMRVDDDFYKRRGGLEQAKALAAQRRRFYNYGFYRLGEYWLYASINIFVCTLPNGLRKWIYKNILRK